MADSRGRCSYCYADAGRDNVKACARCRMVRYCSRECQKKAWPDHKKCCNGDVFKTIQRDPTGPELLHSLNRWTQDWREALHAWSLWALNLPNQPDDFLSKNVFTIELEQKPNSQGRPPRKQFRMVGGSVMSRELVLYNLTENAYPDHVIDNFKTDNRGNNTVQILIIAEKGLLKFLWFGKRDGTTGQAISLKDPNANRDHANLFAQYWEDAMIDVIEQGDPALTQNYPKMVVMEMVPGLKGIVSVPRDGDGPIQVTYRKTVK